MGELQREWIVLTGATRGIGQKIAAELKSRGFSVCALARPVHAGTVLEHVDHTIHCDLRHPIAAETVTELAEFLKTHRTIGLIHAAGLLGPMSSPERPEHTAAWLDWWQEYQATCMVNFTSGAQLVSLCRQDLHHWVSDSGERSPFVLHISSGAAVRPYAGWGAYCASKAALLMEFKCLAAKISADVCHVLSVAPGTVMTDMMQQVLAAHPDEFPALTKFKELEKGGGLVAPALPAKTICDWLLNSGQDDISQWHGELYDVRLSKSPIK